MHALLFGVAFHWLTFHYIYCIAIILFDKSKILHAAYANAMLTMACVSTFVAYILTQHLQGT